MAEKNLNPLDINGSSFNPNMYLDKLFKVSCNFQKFSVGITFSFKECSLKQVMDHETEVIKDTQTLHSDMQTLVYENYNKFISATDTIKKVINNESVNITTVSLMF